MNLFSPLKLRQLSLKNRIVVSPMQQYSAINGVPGNWHMVHLGSRAVGGAGLIMTECTAIEPEGLATLSDYCKRTFTGSIFCIACRERAANRNRNPLAV